MLSLPRCCVCVVEQLASSLGRFNGKGSQIIHLLESSAVHIACLDTMVKIMFPVNYPLYIARRLMLLMTSVRADIVFDQVLL